MNCNPINVAAGLYMENVTIGRTLILNGQQAGNPAPGRVGAESIVQGANPTGGNPVIKINAGSVRIDGFTLTNAITSGAAIGIQVRPVGTGAVITNNIIDGVGGVPLDVENREAIFRHSIDRQSRSTPS